MRAAVRRGVATPCFDQSPTAFVELAVQAEQQGFDGFFVWDHVLWADDGVSGPEVLDPWAILAVAASRTSRILLGPMITPVARRRPWTLARQTATLDLLAQGRTVLGVGLGAPVIGDFGLFGEVTDNRTRGELLDEGLAVLAGLWSGEPFEYHGRHHDVGRMRFRPTPAQGPAIPVWVAGILPARRPMRRAATWQGAVPIAYGEKGLGRPTVDQMAEVADLVCAERGSLKGFDLVVWADVAESPAAVQDEVDSYAEVGVTWYIETAKPSPGWYAGLTDRIVAGP